MLGNIWFIAAVWMGLALIASLISIRIGISVALIEILVGVVAGNLAVGLEGGTLHFAIAGAGTSAGQLHHVLQSTEWTNFLALLGSGVLTFLAGAEIDPISLKANWRASVLIGVLSFALPFVVVWVFAQFVFGWSLHQAQIAGIALSTTSVAVVYAVMIEGGFSDTAMGKMILAACFITDFGTVTRSWHSVRQLQSLATAVCDRDGDRSVVHAALDAIDHHAPWRDTGERTRSKIHLFHPLLSWRPRHYGQKRSGPSRLSSWSRSCRRLSSRQNARSSHA